MDGDSGFDPLEGLEERLISRNRAFESLLALTPARDHFGSQIDDGRDPSEQWNRKKQTKEQKRAAKKAKLDPANQKSVLDVMKEREAATILSKRKRDDPAADEDEDGSEHDGNAKKRRGEDDADTAEARRHEKAEKRKEKRIRKREKAAALKAKAEAKKAKRMEQAESQSQTQPSSGSSQAKQAGVLHDDEYVNDVELDPLPNLTDSGEERTGIMGNSNQLHLDNSSVPSTSRANSPAFDISASHSAASSSSSILPPSVANSDNVSESKRPDNRAALDTAQPRDVEMQPETNDSNSGVLSPKIHLPDIDRGVLQERLRQRIEAMRAARKAEGADGKPAKSRQELLEQRRKKGEQRKAAKKEQRRKAKEEEERRQEERLRGSGSPLSADIFSPRSPPARDNNFSFSRLTFEDGATADASLSGLQDPKSRKGPQDPKTALQAAQAKQSRLAGYDADKRADVADKDMWLNAKKRAHGEVVRDDTNLLKKALKRKEKQKSKSEQQWKDREQAVVKGKEVKQNRREANLAKRKEEKGQKGKKKSAKAGGSKKRRPGFEGSLKA